MVGGLTLRGFFFLIDFKSLILHLVGGFINSLGLHFKKLRFQNIEEKLRFQIAGKL